MAEVVCTDDIPGVPDGPARVRKGICYCDGPQPSRRARRFRSVWLMSAIGPEPLVNEFQNASRSFRPATSASSLSAWSSPCCPAGTTTASGRSGAAASSWSSDCRAGSSRSARTRPLRTWPGGSSDDPIRRRQGAPSVRARTQRSGRIGFWVRSVLGLRSPCCELWFHTSRHGPDE